MATLQIGALCLHPVLSFWVANYRERPRITGPGLVALAGFGVAVGLLALLRLAVGLHRALSLVSVAAFAFFNWTLVRSVSQESGNATQPIVGILFAAFVVALFFTAAYRFGARAAFRKIVLAFSIAIAGTSGIQLMAQSIATRPARLEIARAVGRGSNSISPLPNIYFVVLDGYGRDDVLRTLYRFDNGPFLERLRRNEFFVPSYSNANYTMTHVSVPSMLAMQYVVRENTPLEAKRIALYDVIWGNNPVVRSLQSAGYRYVHLEGGWSGSRCGSAVDVCVHAPLYDDSLYQFLSRTPLQPAVARVFGDSDTVASLSRLLELNRSAAAINSAPHSPTFLFAHVLLPHPPLYVTRECEVRVATEYSGRVSAAVTDRDLIRRRNAYVEQVECVNHSIAKFIAEVDKESVVILTSDHGPDSQGQLLKTVDDWTMSAVWERMSIFAALRLPEACRASLPEDLSPVNFFRIVLGCVLGHDLSLVANEHFLLSPLTIEQTVEPVPREKLDMLRSHSPPQGGS